MEQIGGQQQNIEVSNGRSPSPQQGSLTGMLMPQHTQLQQVVQPQGQQPPAVSSSEDEEEMFSDVDDDYFFDENSEEEESKNGDIGNAEDHKETSSNIDLKKTVDQVNQRIQSTVATTSSMNYIKMLVSKQKKRFDFDGYNLDLSYITDRIIAMGFPAERLESIYRNDMQQVVKFFTMRHPNHYRIYNLCSERKYNHAHFNGNVGEYPFDDHQAPKFDLIFRFCQDLDSWFAKDPRNVAGIHCKAGKGRTGVMICCYLMWSKMYIKAYDAIRYYAMMRTLNKKGVTIPSQIRYILYFEKALERNWSLEIFPIVEMYITKIKLLTVPQFNVFGGCEPWFKISYEDDNKEMKVYQSLQKGEKPKQYKNEAFIEFSLGNGVYVKGDVLIEFFNCTMLKKSEKMFQLWINTAFFESNGVMIIDKFMLDKACKDKKNRNFSKDFHVEIQARHPNLQEFDRPNNAAPEAVVLASDLNSSAPVLPSALGVQNTSQNQQFSASALLPSAAAANTQQSGQNDQQFFPI